MNVNNIGNSGVDGPGRPDRERLDRVEKRRASESRRPDSREVRRERDSDGIELSSSGEDVARIERRARELASQLSAEDSKRQEKLQHVRENLDEIVNSRQSHERAAEAIYADVLRDRG